MIFLYDSKLMISKVRKVEREVVRSDDEMVKLCGDACFNAFKFVSSVDTQVCQNSSFVILDQKYHSSIAGLPSVPEAF